MSLQEQNRMLCILHRNGVNRKNIKFIMNDLSQSKIFDDLVEQTDMIDDWSFIEAEADWLFSDASYKDKVNAIKNIKKKKREFDDSVKKSQYLLDQEKRVQAKREELIKKGIIKPDILTPKRNTKTTTRYGRSPLHEAIFMRDIRLVEKYLKSGKYLDKVDNNGHTPLEMAFYENYKEALILFGICEKKRKKGKKKKKKKKIK